MGDGSTVVTDSFLCTCKACRTFYEKEFGEYASLITTCANQDKMSAEGSSPEKIQRNKIVKYGDRVIVKGRYSGIVKFIGPLDDDVIAPRIYAGVHLDDNIGSTHNGIFRGKRYFHCPRGHGAIVRLSQVSTIPPPIIRPPIYGNPMFPSYKEIMRMRRIRSAKDPEHAFSAPYNAKPRNHSSSSNSITSSVEGSTLKRPRQSPLRLQRSGSSSQTESSEWDPFKSPSRELNQWNDSSQQERMTVYLPRSPRTANDPELDKELEKWRREFGGGERANQLVETLRKLHLAYRQGQELDDEDTEN